MKKMKKIFALLIAMVMVLGMSTSVSAATITINSGAAEGETDNTEYVYYEVFKADIGEAPTVNPETGASTGGKVAYYIPATATALKTAVEGTGLFDLTLSGNGDRWIVELKDENTSAATIASALDIDAVKNNALSSNKDVTPSNFKQSGSGTAVSPDLDPGYYLIKSSLGTVLALETVGTVTINEKNSYPSIPGGKKQTTEENGTAATTDVTASIGQKIYYEIPVKIPANVENKPIYVYDTMTDGLTMNLAITVTGATGLTSLTWVENTEYEATDGEKQYIATIPAANVTANAGQTITLKYFATVNSNAVVNVDETNDAYLVYDHFTGVETTTKVKTHGFTLKKIDGADVTEGMTDAQKFALDALDGAEFTLWTAATGGSKIIVTKVGDVYRADVSATEGGVNVPAGVATIEGLAAGTYYLQEEVAPTGGYNKLTERVAITVSETTSAEVSCTVPLTLVTT